MSKRFAHRITPAEKQSTLFIAQVCIMSFRLCVERLINLAGNRGASLLFLQLFEHSINPGAPLILGGFKHLGLFTVGVQLYTVGVQLDFVFTVTGNCSGCAASAEPRIVNFCHGAEAVVRPIDLVDEIVYTKLMLVPPLDTSSFS